MYVDAITIIVKGKKHFSSLSVSKCKEITFFF